MTRKYNWASMIGQKFQLLTLLAASKDRVLLRCDCGKTKRMDKWNFLRAISCGCVRRSRLKNGLLHLIHGHARKNKETRTYKTWKSMNTRCQNQNDHSYERYGGRGITVCARWSKFENFLADMGEKPLGKSIDRIDNRGNYEPGNCRWATATQQALNRSPMSQQTKEKIRQGHLRRRIPHD